MILNISDHQKVAYDYIEVSEHFKQKLFPINFNRKFSSKNLVMKFSPEISKNQCCSQSSEMSKKLTFTNNRW